jgi:transcriptional/translational regulatory protein YebC/TACO1
MTSGYEDQAPAIEGYGPGGVAVLVVCSETGLAQRVAVREVLVRHGGSGGGLNSVAYLFHPVGVLRYAAGSRLAEQAFDAGAEAVQPLASGEFEVLTDPQDLARVQRQLGSKGQVAQSAGILYRSQQSLRLSAAEREQLAAMIADLQALDGVDAVYTNAALAAPAALRRS